jgi:hypothetical protein
MIRLQIEPIAGYGRRTCTLCGQRRSTGRRCAVHRAHGVGHGIWAVICGSCAQQVYHALYPPRCAQPVWAGYREQPDEEHYERDPAGQVDHEPAGPEGAP